MHTFLVTPRSRYLHIKVKQCQMVRGNFVSSATLVVDGKLIQADVETRRVRDNLTQPS
jgi:hypothetical protein